MNSQQMHASFFLARVSIAAMMSLSILDVTILKPAQSAGSMAFRAMQAHCRCHSFAFPEPYVPTAAGGRLQRLHSPSISQAHAKLNPRLKSPPVRMDSKWSDASSDLKR